MNFKCSSFVYNILKFVSMYRIKAFSIAALLTVLSATTLTNCQKTADAKPTEDTAEQVQNLKTPYTPSDEWNAYWYQGLAEITSYSLEQSRYGEIHTGNVVNIFVTEDFSKSKQVKFDNPPAADEDKINVLKLNQSIKFNTGVYPYSLMLSSFLPVDANNYPHALKVTGSMQEWCGMAFFQLNNRAKTYDIEQRSYFEHEGDKNITINKVLMEDELWNMIRLAPDRLPAGEQNVLPGSLYLRLSHKPLEAVKAVITHTEDNSSRTVEVNYPTLNRKLAITYSATFPYKITGWTDAYPGIDGKILTTKATLKKEVMLDYWAKHTNSDLPLREELGLPQLFQ